MFVTLSRDMRLISVSVYNDADDVERLMRALTE